MLQYIYLIIDTLTLDYEYKIKSDRSRIQFVTGSCQCAKITSRRGDKSHPLGVSGSAYSQNRLKRTAKKPHNYVFKLSIQMFNSLSKFNS